MKNVRCGVSNVAVIQSSIVTPEERRGNGAAFAAPTRGAAVEDTDNGAPLETSC